MAEVRAIELQRRPLMPPELLKAAIEGNDQVLTEMLGLEEGGSDQTTVTIEACGEIESSKEDNRPNFLQSATFMGNTVLHVLSSNNHDLLASKICNKDGSLLKARNRMLETPLHCAAKSGCTRTLVELLKYDKIWSLRAKEMVRERNCHGETALHEAARHNHERIIRELMKVDPELAYEVDNYGISALEVALARGNNDVVTSLTEKLSDQKINTRICSSRPDKRALLHSSIENEGNAHKPIKMSTSANILTSPPIHLVASVGNTDGAELLLQNDASLVYLQDSEGLFPIHVAARMGHAEMVVVFMLNCRDFGELLDHRGRNFLHIAAEENKSNIFVKLFPKSDDDRRPSIWEGILTRMINATDNEGNTALHLAAQKGCKLVMKTLIANENLDVNLRNRRGLTPFDISMIQVKESTENSPDLQAQLIEHIEKKGATITLEWFRKFINIMGKLSNGRKDTDNFMAQLQIIGLGAVLITTVTFAAAFTLPGGNMDSGSPVLGRKYVFKAFILADTFAFLQSFFCTVMLMYGGLSSIDPGAQKMFLSLTLFLFSSAARSLVLAFGLGLHLVLAPISRGFSILVLFMVLGSVLLDLSSRLVIKCVNIFVDLKEDLEDIPGSHTFFSWVKSYFHVVSVVSPFLFTFLFSLIH